MKLSTMIFFLTASASAIDPQPGKRDATTVSPTTDGGFNLASLSSALVNLANQTATGNFGNISPPPKSFLPEILSAVPLSVVGELMDAQSRSALASELSAGNTPAWYSSLPADVKSYMSVVRAQISGGALTATTGLAYETTSTARGASTTGTTNTATKTATGATSTSSGMAGATQPTLFAGSMIGALGVLGLALAL